MDRKLSIEDMCDRYPGTTRQFWAVRRYEGKLPAFQKVGRNIYYAEADVIAFDAASRRTSTSESVAS